MLGFNVCSKFFSLIPANSRKLLSYCCRTIDNVVNVLPTLSLAIDSQSHFATCCFCYHHRSILFAEGVWKKFPIYNDLFTIHRSMCVYVERNNFLSLIYFALIKVSWQSAKKARIKLTFMWPNICLTTRPLSMIFAVLLFHRTHIRELRQR